MLVYGPKLASKMAERLARPWSLVLNRRYLLSRSVDLQNFWACLGDFAVPIFLALLAPQNVNILEKLLTRAAYCLCVSPSSGRNFSVFLWLVFCVARWRSNPGLAPKMMRWKGGFLGGVLTGDGGYGLPVPSGRTSGWDSGLNQVKDCCLAFASFSYVLITTNTCSCFV